jgi:ribonuclease D
MTVLFIDNASQLDAFCQQIAGSEWLTVDTEFLREKTYYPQLCLIQVANEDLIACIDPLAIEDLTPLLTILYSPETTLVFHAARQDLELLYQLKGELPKNIFDTQLAATVLGHGDQIGYGNLVKACLNVELEKAHSRTDWTQRPLEQAQIDYAADDVRYLRDVYLQLKQQLIEKNRLAWLDEDFRNLIDPLTYDASPDTIWRKIKGVGKLKGIQLATLQKLAAWREHNAVRSNRPRRWILKDDVLVDLARLAPKDLHKLERIRGLESGTIKRFGQTLLSEIKAAAQTPKESWPTLNKPAQLSNQQDALIDILMGLLRHYCDVNAIAPAAVATRKDLERIVRGETDIPLLHGWRNELVGQHLNQFLNGQLTVTADIQQLHIQ